jgi:hypothetical protein
VAAGHFIGTSHVDLAVANNGSNTVSILGGDGKGNFRLASTLAVGSNPDAIAAGNFGNGSPDLVTANAGSGDLSVLLNNGHGTFQPAQNYAAGSKPAGLLVGDFSADDKQDVTAINYSPGEVYILDGNGDGTFQPAKPLGIFGPADEFSAVAGGDFTRDGQTDMALANVGRNAATVLLGNGDGTFSPPGAFSDSFRVRPILADLTGQSSNGESILDAVTVAQNGDILFRAGRATPPGQIEQFADPIVLNPGNPANDVALVTDTGPGGQVVYRLAALDRNGNAITFYSFNAAVGGFTATPGPAVQPGAVHIASVDLNGDGRGDLVVSNGATGTVSIFTANRDGSFSTYTTPPLGNGPSDLTLANVSGGPGPDVIVTDQVSGDVTVLLNTPTDPFTQEYRYRAGTGPYGTVEGNGSTALQSLDQSAVAVVGNITGGSTPDLLVTDSGRDSFTLLRSAGGGTFFNPLPFGTGSDPTAAVVGAFATNSPNADVAILDQASGTISVYLGDGHGNFTPGQVLPAGNAPTGLALAYLGGSNAPPDLVVTNQYGDLLTLPGDGDGTFGNYTRADQNASLALVPGSTPQLMVSNEAGDSISFGTSSGSYQLGRNSATPIENPSAIQVVPFADGSVGVLIANSGFNEVLLIHATPTGNGGYAVQGTPQVIPVGTDPVGLTVAYLNGATAPPDVLVADEESNDVIVLTGSGTGLNWSLAETQRLQVDPGPVSTTVTQVGGTTELLVTDSQGNEVQGLPERGPGHFSDRPGDVQVWQTPPGSDPQQAFVGNFDGGSGQDLAILNAGSSNLTVYPNFADNHNQAQSVPTGGTDPVSAVETSLNGYASLVVANNGDGRVALVAGGPNGPQVTEIEEMPGVVIHPSDVVLAGANDKSVAVFVADGAGGVAPFVFGSATLVVSPGFDPSTPTVIEGGSAGRVVVGNPGSPPGPPPGGGSGGTGGGGSNGSGGQTDLILPLTFEFIGATQIQNGGGPGDGSTDEFVPVIVGQLQSVVLPSDEAANADSFSQPDTSPLPIFSGEDRLQIINLQPLNPLGPGIIAVALADEGGEAGSGGNAVAAGAGVPLFFAPNGVAVALNGGGRGDDKPGLDDANPGDQFRPRLAPEDLWPLPEPPAEGDKITPKEPILPPDNTPPALPGPGTSGHRPGGTAVVRGTARPFGAQLGAEGFSEEPVDLVRHQERATDALFAAIFPSLAGQGPKNDQDDAAPASDAWPAGAVALLLAPGAVLGNWLDHPGTTRRKVSPTSPRLA